MPRKTLGDRPLTNAERQARHRAARAISRPVIRYRAAADRRSRAQRWRDAPGLRRGRLAELVTLQSEYTQWFEALPENLQEKATGEALQAIVDLDLDELIAIVPPRGFGRD
jgi:hypothetical protein